MLTEVKKYAKILVKMKALNEILEALKEPVLLELQGCKDGQAIAGPVAFNLTTSTQTKFTEEFNDKVNALKQKEIDAGRTSSESKPTFRAEISKVLKEQEFLKITEYKKQFSK